MRPWLLLPLFAACTTQDTPKITILQDQEIAVEYRRQNGHSFTNTTATLNGQLMTLSFTSEGQEGTSWSHPYIPAQAQFTAPLGSVDGDLVLEISDNGDHFTMEVPAYGSPRAINLHTAVDVLHADDWIELDDGVPTDDIEAILDVEADGRFCFSQEDTRHSPGLESIRVPPTGRNVCASTPPPPGTTIAAELTLRAQVTLPTSRCDGPGLDCEPVRLDVPAITTPTTLAY